MKKSLSEGWRSSDPLYWLNHKHVRVLNIFLHFLIHLVSSSRITSHPTYNDQTSVVCCSYLLPTFLALSLSVPVISPFAGWWCRQEWHLSVRKETEHWSTLAQQSASGYKWLCQAAFWSCSLVFSTVLLAAVTCTPLCCLFVFGIGAWVGPEGEAEIERDWVFPALISMLWKTYCAFRLWIRRHWPPDSLR